MVFTIHERLSRAEKSYIQAVGQGGHALEAFGSMWSVLLRDIRDSVQAKSLESEVTALADAVASRILALNDSLLDFQAHADAVQSELEDTFARIDFNGPSDETHMDTIALRASSGSLPRRPGSSSSNHFSNRSCPPYIEPAYQWLLANLHNPYPPTETREAISIETGCSRKDIDKWFVDVRRRIGWSTFRNQQFSNKRSRIVDAATRFFVQGDEKRPLDPNIELKFSAIEAYAEGLYSSKFVESALATKLDVAVKDMTPEMKAEAKKFWKQQTRIRDKAEQDAQAALSYPSPDPSPTRTPEPSASSALSDDCDHGLTTASDAAINRERCCPLSLSGDKPNKDIRLSSRNTVVSTSLPSRSPIPCLAPSLNQCPIATNPRASVLPTTLPDHPSTARKRRLSDADSNVILKRPRNFHVGPGLHAASDPLPLPSALPELSSIDDWFHRDFGIPNPVSVEAPDESVPFDIDFDNYPAFDYGALQEIFDSPAGSVEQSINHTIPQAPEAPSTQIPSYALDICTNDFNYDELFGDPEEPTPELLAGNILPSTSFSIPSSNNPALNAFDPNSFTSILFPDSIVDTAGIADFSAPVFQDPASGQQWPFPPINSPHAMLGPLDELHNPGLNFFAQDNSFMFDPSMMGLYTSSLSGDNGSLPPSTMTDKAAKQRKLLEMREEARRLEAEIAAS